MDVKFGKVRPNKNIFVNSSANRDDNFFTSNQPKEQPNYQESATNGTRLNDLDSNILENSAYQDISDEMFRIEHRIGMLEGNLSKITNEIEALESLGAEIQVTDLKDRKQKVEKELQEMNKKYSELGIGSKLSGHIASAVNFGSKKKVTQFSRFKKFVSKKIFAKISKKFGYTQDMKEALGNLSNINTSVDELIKLRVPHGETVSRYEKLTAYLNKANVIHSQISRNMDSIAKRKI